jgi:hypothetical protein
MHSIVQVFQFLFERSPRCACADPQAAALRAGVRKGEAGELVVYANRITRTETDAKGEETEREIF